MRYLLAFATGITSDLFPFDPPLLAPSVLAAPAVVCQLVDRIEDKATGAGDIQLPLAQSVS
ncbi:hypothetical protein, partial [Sansalvadorimonas verongulae]|uniref:hypothetical protein n=1 Tax=Sansalvadorimonas verongulae TaxID=2172824 RepID=UPI001E580EC1